MISDVTGAAVRSMWSKSPTMRVRRLARAYSSSAGAEVANSLNKRANGFSVEAIKRRVRRPGT